MSALNHGYSPTLGRSGSRLEASYWAFRDTDLTIIAEVPDNVTAVAVSLTVNADGAAAAKVTVLLAAEEIDAATKKTLAYRPPGR
jgi:uncharacterized protein with GYD domain